jgi:hypothetical protein
MSCMHVSTFFNRLRYHMYARKQHLTVDELSESHPLAKQAQMMIGIGCALGKCFNKLTVFMSFSSQTCSNNGTHIQIVFIIK